MIHWALGFCTSTAQPLEIKKIVKRALIFALEKRECNEETKCKWFGFKSSIDKSGELTCFSNKRPNSCHCQYQTWLNVGDRVPALHKSPARTTLDTFHLINGPLPPRYCQNTRVIKSNNFKSKVHFFELRSLVSYLTNNKTCSKSRELIYLQILYWFCLVSIDERLIQSLIIDIKGHV